MRRNRLNEEDFRSQNKLSGKWIAAGRATYTEYAPGKFGYIFQDNYGFNWKVDPRVLEVDSITVDDLMDCVDQLEEMGTFQELRKKYPTPTDLRFYGGFLNSGLVITSRTNPLITMSVTFHSSDRMDSPDIQVGWFFDEHKDREPNKMDNMKVRSVGEPHQDVRGDEPVDVAIETEDIQRRLSKDERVIGRVLWFHKKQAKGVVEGDNKKQFYFDQSTILTEDQNALKQNVLVKFTPRYVRESSVWVADDLEIFDESEEAPRTLTESATEGKRGQKWAIKDWAGNYPFEPGGHQGSGHLHEPSNTFDSAEDAEDFLVQKLGKKYDSDREEYEVFRLEGKNEADDDDEPLWTLETDKEPSHELLDALKKELDKKAPDFGEYEVAITDGGVNLHGVHSPSGFENVGKALTFASQFLERHGINVETHPEAHPIREQDEDEVSDEDVMEYLEQWRDNEGYSDLNLMLDRGLIIMACDSMSGSGAIDPGQHPKESRNRKIEQRLVDIAEQAPQSKEYKDERKEFFKNMEVWINKNTNEHYFIPYGDVDYFTRQKDLKRSGYEFDSGYDKDGKEYSESTLTEDEDLAEGAQEQKIIDKWLAQGGSIGKEPQRVWSKDDTLYSYKTVIAKKEGKKLYVNSTKYSSTTTRLTQYLAHKAEEQGLKVELKDESFFDTSMPHKLHYTEVPRSRVRTDGKVAEAHGEDYSFADKESQKEALATFINNMAQWRYDYETSHKDAGSNYFDVMEPHVLDDFMNRGSDRYDEELYDVIKKYLDAKVPKKEIWDAILDSTTPTAGSIERESNAITAFNIGEIEDQLTGLSGRVNGKEVNDVYKALSDGLDENDLKEVAKNVTEGYWKPGDDYVYVNAEYQMWHMIVDPEKLDSILSEE